MGDGHVVGDAGPVGSLVLGMRKENMGLILFIHFHGKRIKNSNEHKGDSKDVNVLHLVIYRWC